VVVSKRPLRVRRARNEDYDIWRGLGKAGLSGAFWVDLDTGEVNRRQFKREQLVTFFAKQAPALIAMEACGSAHYWARRFASFGYQVRLIAPSFVRPFVKRNKDGQQGRLKPCIAPRRRSRRLS
jgi:transposase